MNNQPFIFGVVGILIGAAISAIVCNVIFNKPQTTKTNSMSDMNHDMSTMKTNNSMTMESMTASLKGKTGDEFDRLFISEMIEHHHGAIDMAELAKDQAKHDEIKNLSEDIISAQKKEINQMNEWQSSWGYLSK